MFRADHHTGAHRGAYNIALSLECGLSLKCDLIFKGSVAIGTSNHHTGAHRGNIVQV